MADPTLIVAAVSVGVGIAAGAFWAWLGWLKSGEAFEARKFTLGIVTGAISSLALVLASISGILAAATPTEQVLALIGLFLAVGGADTLRTGISGTIVQREPETEPTQ